MSFTGIEHHNSVLLREQLLSLLLGYLYLHHLSYKPLALYSAPHKHKLGPSQME